MRTRSGKGKAAQPVQPALDDEPLSSPSSIRTSEISDYQEPTAPSPILPQSPPSPSPNTDTMPEITAYYKKPVLTIAGIPESLSRAIAEDELNRALEPVDRQLAFERDRQIDYESTPSSEDESVENDDSAEASFSPAGKRSSARGRGGRGRGNRGRGRGRGRGSRGGRGGARGVKAQQTVKEDDKPFPQVPTPGLNSPLPTSAASSQNNYGVQVDGQSEAAAGLRDESPSEQLIKDIVTAVKTTTEFKAPSISKTSEPNAKPVYLDEELTEDDLPPPFASTSGSTNETDIDDQAEVILRERFLPMTDPQKFIAALTKHAPAERTTEVLYAIAENTQRALEEWQDEYLEIDKRVAPHANNGARKPVTGGRVPADPQVFEDIKEADLYSYTYDHRKPPGKQDPWNQRVGTEYVGGRELRHRRARDVTTDDLAGSEEDVGKRRRRAVQRFDATPASDAASRTRKREPAASETPEPQALPRKRGKLGSGKKNVPQRIQEISREESTMTTSASDDDDGDVYEAAPEQKSKRRGRPPGSKNHTQRKDAGIKKGPRTKKPLNTSPGPNGDRESDMQQNWIGQYPPAPEYQGPAQNQPFHVQGYTHAPPSSIPAASMGPVMNVDRSFITSRPPPPHPFTPPPQMEPTPQYQPNVPMNMMQPTMATPMGVLAPVPAERSSSGKKKVVKSEKRSASMTQWWADRKARQAEQRQQEARNQATMTHAQMPVPIASYGNPNGYTGPYPQPGYAPSPFPGPSAGQNTYRPIAPSGLHQNHASPHLQPQPQPQPLQHHQHHLPQQHHHSPHQHFQQQPLAPNGSYGPHDSQLPQMQLQPQQPLQQVQHPFRDSTEAPIEDHHRQVDQEIGMELEWELLSKKDRKRLGVRRPQTKHLTERE